MIPLVMVLLKYGSKGDLDLNWKAEPYMADIWGLLIQEDIEIPEKSTQIPSVCVCFQ